MSLRSPENRRTFPLLATFDIPKTLAGTFINAVASCSKGRKPNYGLVLSLSLQHETKATLCVRLSQAATPTLLVSCGLKARTELNRSTSTTTRDRKCAWSLFRLPRWTYPYHILPLAKMGQGRWRATDLGPGLSILCAFYRRKFNFPHTSCY